MMGIVRNNILLFDFDVEVDADKGLLGEPWSYDRHLVSIQHFDGSKVLKDIDFKFCSFWIQIHDIPFKHMTEDTAKEIGDTIGTVIKLGDVSEWKGGTFLRIRVRVDTTRPLYRGRRVTFEEGLERWVSFQYERLPNLCFWCGLFSHDDKECDIWLKSKGTLKVEQQQFGHWIRANPFGSNRSRSIEVKGFESRQPRSRGAMEQSEEVVMEQSSQIGEGVSPGGGEENQTTTATAEDVYQKVSVSNMGTGFRGPPDGNNKQADFEAIIAEIDKEISPIQPLSNPGDSENELRTKVNLLGEDVGEDLVDIRKGLGSQPSVQISQSKDSQSREVGLLGCTTGQSAMDEQKKSANIEKSKITKGPGGSGKIEIGPGPQSDLKKGQRIRVFNRSNSDLREEVMYVAESLKRKAKEIQGSELCSRWSFFIFFSIEREIQ
uniref:Zinc knuckle CX2CX4HX4C domain-containing protein n=1 Tax=Quercus lobata TaxID=97700 RepID=A0A7N2KK34_QUELO